MFMIFFLIVVLYIVWTIYKYLFRATWVNPSGKYVLISGCDSGFGFGSAVELDRQGYSIFAGVYTNEGKKLLSEKLSSKATVFKLDITNQQDIENCLELVKRKTINLHALINNAGIGKGGLIDWTSMSTYREVMDVNFFSHVAMTKTFLPLLCQQADSRVINLCSMCGYFSAPGLSAYSASKYALESFSDCLRREMFVFDLKVSIIEPGFMKTPIIEGHLQEQEKLWQNLSIEIKERWGESYAKNSIIPQAENFFVKYAENPSKVIRVIQHAVSSRKPMIRYRPGWQSSFLVFALEFLIPTRLTDFILQLIYFSGERPAAVNRQLAKD